MIMKDALLGDTNNMELNEKQNGGGGRGGRGDEPNSRIPKLLGT